MTFDPHKIAERYRDDGFTWADKNAAADLLEQTQKTLLSHLALKFITEAKSVAKAEMMAMATQEYQDHLKLAIEARKQSNKAKIQYYADSAFIDLKRSQESTKRAEMNLQ